MKLKLNLLVKIAGLVMQVISPELRGSLVEMLDTLEEKAQKTSNPWDDLLVDLLRSLINA